VGKQRDFKLNNFKNILNRRFMDKDYWEAFYAMQNKELKPSLFAKYVVEKIAKEQNNLIELGCGNGRDAILFANNQLNVLAVDQCKSEIEFLSHTYRKFENIKFKQKDFTSLPNDKKFHIVYSRFTLHSISSEQEKQVLKWAYKNLESEGFFCIEARGQKNEIYGKGEPVEGEKDAFILDNHYRRFINLEVLCTELKNIGFIIKQADENKGFAPYNGEDETYIRVIACKL
jgi:tellurite methyltransferase